MDLLSLLWIFFIWYGVTRFALEGLRSGNWTFFGVPTASMNRQYFHPSGSHTTCHWKGEASYYDVVVNGETNKDAAWYYADPSDAAKEIKDHVAFWKGVQVTS